MQDEVNRVSDAEVFAPWLKESLLYHLDVEQVVDKAEQELQLADDNFDQTRGCLVLLHHVEELLEEHDRGRQGRAELMRYG